MHPIDVCLVSFVDPFPGSLSDFVLYLRFGRLGVTSCGDLLNVRHDIVHSRCLTAVSGWAFGRVVARLVTFETSVGRRVGCFSSVVLGGRVWAVSGLTCRRGVRPLMGRVVPRLGVWKGPMRFGLRRFSTTIVVVPSIVS